MIARRPTAGTAPTAWQRLKATPPRGIFTHPAAVQTDRVRRPSFVGNDIPEHPLADATVSAALKRRADEIQQAFAAIEPALQELARRQFEDGFESWAAEFVRERLGVAVPHELLAVSWTTPLDVRRLHASCVLATFCRLIERSHDRHFASMFEGESADELIRRWGFHAVDITPCADGRLGGVIDHILRVPPSVVAFRKSYAGAMFDVEESLRHWESVELRRWREANPNAAGTPTRFLKVGVYHFSSVNPHREGCAAHGSDDSRAAAAVLERLQQFEQAVRETHGGAAGVASLLIGVDTDTDAIRVHVPDAAGRQATGRHVDAGRLYDLTAGLTREAAKERIRAEVATCAGVAPDEQETAGMRWFCAYLLKNNLAQIDAVRRRHGLAYADGGHTERLILIGDAADDVQLRNLAFQAQMDTIEEGAADLDVGVRILEALHGPRGLAVPVLVHTRFDRRIPGAQERARTRAARLSAAVEARFASLVARGALLVRAVVRGGDEAALHIVDRSTAASPRGFTGRQR